MRYNRRARLDTSQIRDLRGRRGGAGFGGGLGGGFGRGGFGRGGIGMGRGIGGGIGGLVLLLVLLFAANGGGEGGQVGTGTGQEPFTGVNGAGGSTGDLTSCDSGDDIEQNRDCRFVLIENSVQDHWEQQFERLGQTYEPGSFTTFTGSVTTGCGQATSAVGPFYCPADNGVYLDLGFFDELERRFGAQGGDFAEAYIIAHEYGHHVQNLTGQNDRVETREGPESDAVRLELQADCYAGVWAGNATEPGPGAEPLILDVTADDIATAVDAAERVGDDYIQERFGNGVNRESWTHGSSEQRRRWFEIGFSTGDPRSCDTFGAETL